MVVSKQVISHLRQHTIAPVHLIATQLLDSTSNPVISQPAFNLFAARRLIAPCYWDWSEQCTNYLVKVPRINNLWNPGLAHHGTDREINFRGIASMHSIIRDSATFGNLLAFVIYREYITALKDLPRLGENDQHKFYMFLININQIGDFKILQGLQKQEILSIAFSDAVLRKLEELRDVVTFVEYACKGTIESIFSTESEELETSDYFHINPNSRVGLFLRKTALAFYGLTFEHLVKFHTNFFEFCDKVAGFKLTAALPHAQTGPVSANDVFAYSNDIIRKVGQLGSLSPSEHESIMSTLDKYQEIYPQMPEPHMASHLLAVRQLNFSRAESELYKTFELLIANSSPAGQSILPSDAKPAEIWLQLTLAAVNMHYKFGHFQKARALQRQALTQALELNDVKFIKLVKKSHCIVNGMGEPIRYTGLEPGNSVSDYDVSELHISLLNLIDKGSSAQRVILEYFNSVDAAMSENMASSLLELGLFLSIYGYPLLENTLLQCAVVLDSLHPCPSSDDVLTTALCQIAHVCANAGTSRGAVVILDSATSTIGHLEQQRAMFARTRVEIQVEQALSIGIDFNQCERLINTLNIYSPWEARLKLVELDLKRGNTEEALACLQRLAYIAKEWRIALEYGDTGDDESTTVEQEDKTEDDIAIGLFKCHITNALVLTHSEIRARLLLVDIFASNGMYSQALKEIRRVEDRTITLQFISFRGMIYLLTAVLGRLEGSGSNRGRAYAVPKNAITAMLHQTPPALRLRLINLAHWLTFTEDGGGGAEARVVWMERLRRSAVFFGNTGNKYALQKTVDLYTALQEGSDLTKEALAKHLFPISY